MVSLSCTYSRKTSSLLGWSVQNFLKALLNTLNDTEFFLPFSTVHHVKSLSFNNVYTSSLKKVPLLGGASSYSPLYGGLHKHAKAKGGDQHNFLGLNFFIWNL